MKIKVTFTGSRVFDLRMGSDAHKPLEQIVKEYSEATLEDPFLFLDASDVEAKVIVEQVE